MKNSYLKLIAVTVLCCVYWGGVGAQCPSDLILKKQSEVDSFPKNFPWCKKIVRSLTVSGDISSLDSLIQLTAIHDLSIKSNFNLLNLKGLENVKEFNTLNISNNYEMSDISQIANIYKINTLTIDNNPSLRTIDGFDSINEIKAIINWHNADRNSVGTFLVRSKQNFPSQN